MNICYFYEGIKGHRSSDEQRKWWWQRKSAGRQWVNRRKRGGVVCSLLILILLMAPFQWPQKGHSHPFNKLVTMGVTEQGRARVRRQKVVEKKKIKPLGLFSSSNSVCVDSRPGTAWLCIWLLTVNFDVKKQQQKNRQAPILSMFLSENLLSG